MAELKYIKNFETVTTDPVLFLLHGWGANERDWIPTFPPMFPQLNYVSVRSPIVIKPGSYMFTDPMTGVTAPWQVTQEGYAWTELPKSMDLNLYSELNFSSDAQYVFQQAEHGVELMKQLIDELIPVSTKIIPIGFSQGSMMTSMMVRNFPEKLQAAVMLSGYTHPKPQTKDNDLKDLPVFVGYGDADNVLPQTYLKYLADFMASHAKATVKVYPGQEHTVGVPELHDIQEFLNLVISS